VEGRLQHGFGSMRREIIKKFKMRFTRGVQIIYADLFLLQKLVGEVFVGLGYHADNGRFIDGPRLERGFIGDNQIYAIGLSVYMRVNPSQFFFEQFRWMIDRAEHTHATRFGHSGHHHIAAMAKGQ